jgi:hypothetical protein
MRDHEHMPTRADAEMKLLDLIEGRCSRGEASSWAEYWLYEDGVLGGDLFHDLALLEALKDLSGADMITTDRPYLYDEVDFRAWLHALQQAT